MDCDVWHDARPSGFLFGLASSHAVEPHSPNRTYYERAIRLYLVLGGLLSFEVPRPDTMLHPSAFHVI